MPLNTPLGFGFPTATPHGLISRRNTNSQAHSSKGTLSPQKAPTACKHTVSGTISLPSRGTFHHSLTVLIRYRSSGSIQAYQVVLADSHEISRAPCYSGERHTTTMTVSSTGLTPPTVWHSPPVRLPRRHNAQGGDPRTTHPTTPIMQPSPGITHNRFSHHPLSLATTHGITVVFSSYGY